MALMFGLARIGRDAEVRYTPQNEAVIDLSLAFTFGKKGQDGKRPTQWVQAAIWGKRAEALKPHLLKGSQVSVTLSDVHIETYQGSSGPGAKLVGKVTEIDLVGGQPAAAPRPAPAPAPRAPAPSGGSGFDDMDDDIPF